MVGPLYILVFISVVSKPCMGWTRNGIQWQKHWPFLSTENHIEHFIKYHDTNFMKIPQNDNLEEAFKLGYYVTISRVL